MYAEGYEGEGQKWGRAAPSDSMIGLFGHTYINSMQGGTRGRGGDGVERGG